MIPARLWLLFALLTPLLSGCEPVNLARIDFKNCVVPSAAVGATLTRLEAELFIDQPTGDVGTISWNFGDGRGLPQTGERVLYTFDRAGTYTITMTLTNRCNQTLTVKRTITLTN